MNTDGICIIKPEFIIKDVAEVREEVAEKSSDLLDTDEPDKKRPKLSKSMKRERKGQNKARGLPYKVSREANLCRIFFDGKTEEKCKNEKCIHMHDIEKYMSIKPKDIGETCYNYSTKGYCSRGLTCRFASAHLDADFNNLKDDKYDKDAKETTLNQLDLALQVQLRKKQYNFDKSKKIVEHFEKLRKEKTQLKPKVENSAQETPVETEKPLGYSPDDDLIKLRPSEKKTINFKDKILLSPLTTVGNLPFRRICKEYGVDVTCGEMACALPVVNGAPQEWALAKRHESEDIFGVQLCGNNANLVSYAAQVLTENCQLDFVDLNLGCPIDLIFEQGGGSALLRRQNILEVMIRSCVTMLDVPLTVKTRTGIYANKSIAHELVPKFEEWGASLVTVHGRSREQRYTKKADWDYIEECASKVKRIPVMGNGDIMSYDDYNLARETAKSISGVMVGRGALIKPWLFQEIKEQKNLDLSSTERFDMMKRYVNYGLEHWGSDTYGVENTRRFFLEWQSFLYRYVPYGLLERPPQRINDRPDRYHGRDDLETLMASSNCADWIKLSEMLLGPVPDGYHFLPKHKANSY